MAAGSLTLGGNMSVAVGPLGRNGEASSSLNTSGSVATMRVNISEEPIHRTEINDIGTPTPRPRAFSEV
jgi:hypothetical protein